MSVNRSDCDKIEIDYIYEAVCPSCKEYVVIGTMNEEKEITYCPHCGKNLRADEILKSIRDILATTSKEIELPHVEVDSTLVPNSVINTSRNRMYYNDTHRPYNVFFDV